MQNKANFSKSQMFITSINTSNYNEKSELDTWSKQTQTKPISKSGWNVSAEDGMVFIK